MKTWSKICKITFVTGILGAGLFFCVPQSQARDFDDWGHGWDHDRGNWPVRKDPAPTPVPEPATLALLGTGIASLAAARKRLSKA